MLEHLFSNFQINVLFSPFSACAYDVYHIENDISVNDKQYISVYNWKQSEDFKRNFFIHDELYWCKMGLGNSFNNHSSLPVYDTQIFVGTDVTENLAYAVEYANSGIFLFRLDIFCFFRIPFGWKVYVLATCICMTFLFFRHSSLNHFIL